MDGEDQLAASQMSEMDTALDHAQEEAMPLVEWALTPMEHCYPKEEYSRQAGLAERACRSPTCLTDASASCWAVFNKSALRLEDCNDSNGGPFGALSTVGKSQGETV